MAGDLFAALGKLTPLSTAQNSDGWPEKEARLLAACHPYQRDLVQDLGRRVAALVGRGGGKTTAVRARFVRRLNNTPRARCLYIANTRDQAIELMWWKLKEVLEELKISALYNETSLRCTLAGTGSILRLAGADDKRAIEKYRGIPHHEVWIDESASYPLELLSNLVIRIIGPRLGDYGGMMGLVGTPGSILAGLFYEATRPGSETSRLYSDRALPEYDNWQKWSLHRWTLEDGAPHVPALQRLWAEAQREKESQGWSDSNQIWLREYMGQWAADNADSMFRYRRHDDEGNPLNYWEPTIPTGGVAAPPEHLENPIYVYTIDFGHYDPTALNIFCYDPNDPERRIYHVYSFARKGMYIKQIAELIMGEEVEGEPWPNFDDPGGLVGETGHPAHFVADPQGLAQGYIAELQALGIRIKLANQKEKVAGVELVNSSLVDGKLLIIGGSELEEQLLTLQWEVDDYGRLKESGRARNDHADTLIYARREVVFAKLDVGEPAVAETYLSVPEASEDDLFADLGEFDDIC